MEYQVKLGFPGAGISSKVSTDYCESCFHPCLLQKFPNHQLKCVLIQSDCSNVWS